jgi:hypothetical protein
VLLIPRIPVGQRADVNIERALDPDRRDLGVAAPGDSRELPADSDRVPDVFQRLPAISEVERLIGERPWRLADVELMPGGFGVALWPVSEAAATAPGLVGQQVDDVVGAEPLSRSGQAAIARRASLPGSL